MTHPSDDDASRPFLDTTRAGYDVMAADYDKHFRHELESMRLGRAMLNAFAEYVRVDGAAPRPVADIGCGAGRVTAHLAGLGLDVLGIDLSPGMLAVARREHPGLRFQEGTMTALDLPDGSLSGLVAWYSLVHIPPDLVPDVLAEFHRVLAPGAPLLLAFQVGEGTLRLTEALGHTVALDFHRWTPETLGSLLKAAGLPVRAHMVREPERAERTPHACILAHRPA
ncbi:class I SAM-dependent methyltransferase [Streptomyces sp. TRM64462]|uniref:class I SAM-dependent DNA methyltransferase n=1 Tax=Streptomyces sp. TRM64462 TaxID=2741726 RepID=UPI00158672A9|nr:class I SAM-dependent methyltransferase [Streptomyces sp. TRM64462]